MPGDPHTHLGSFSPSISVGVPGSQDEGAAVSQLCMPCLAWISSSERETEGPWLCLLSPFRWNPGLLHSSDWLFSL